MRHQNTIFHGLLNEIPRHRFRSLVNRHGGDKHVRTLDCKSQMVAQITLT